MHEWQVDDVDKRLNKVKLSHQLLPELHVFSLFLLQVILIFGEPGRDSSISLENMVLLGLSTQKFFDFVEQPKNLDLFLLRYFKSSRTDCGKVLFE